MKNYIYSTVSSSVRFCKYDQSNPGVTTIEESFIVKGGANVIDKRLLTPRGVVTEVSNETLAWLTENREFQQMIAKGFLVLQRDQSRQRDPEVVRAEYMEGRDKAAQSEALDYAEGGRHWVRPIEDVHGDNLPVRNK